MGELMSEEMSLLRGWIAIQRQLNQAKDAARLASADVSRLSDLETAQRAKMKGVFFRADAKYESQYLLVDGGLYEVRVEAGVSCYVNCHGSPVED